MTRDAWIKLQRGDDWGNTYYAVKALTPGGFADARRGLKFTEGERVAFKTRAGARAVYGVLRAKKVSATVSDHGHSYAVSTTEWEVHYEGLHADLSEVLVKRSWAEGHAPGGKVPEA